MATKSPEEKAAEAFDKLKAKATELGVESRERPQEQLSALVEEANAKPRPLRAQLADEASLL